MTTIIFDFDDTLFNTKKLKKNITKSLKNSGYKRKDIEHCYKEVIKNGHYSFEKHIKELKKIDSKIDPKKALECLYDILKENYIFRHVPTNLNKLKKGYNIILLTKGHTKYQKIKIKSANFDKIFDKKSIHITEIPKEKILKNIKTQGQVYFLNNNQKENQEVRKLYPKFKYFLITPEHTTVKYIKQIEKGFLM